MSYKTLATVAVVIVLAAFLAFGCARMWHHASPEKKAEWMVRKISKELDLTPEQKTTLNRIKDEILVKRTEMKGVRAEIVDEIISETKSAKVDEKKLNQLLDDKQVKMKEMRSFLISKFAEFHSMLTPEQRSKLAEKIEKFHKRK